MFMARFSSHNGWGGIVEARLRLASRAGEAMGDEFSAKMAENPLLESTRSYQF